MLRIIYGERSLRRWEVLCEQCLLFFVAVGRERIEKTVNMIQLWFAKSKKQIQIHQNMI